MGKQVLAAIPLGRATSPKEVASIASFLVTGGSFYANGVFRGRRWTWKKPSDVKIIMECTVRDYDLVLRGGTVVDGSGGEPIIADVAIENGRIAELGTVSGRGREEIEAKGKFVMPGFVDIHTHYDGHVAWAKQLQPSSPHGVTTIVTGNCGVGFAPCRADDHEILIHLMEGVEDIPEIVLKHGLPWSWETFPQYLDFLEKRHFDMDVATQVPHAPLRVYAMGRRGAQREPATEADIEKMAHYAREAIEAGALGFSTSRNLNHRSSDGTSLSIVRSEEAELQGIANGLKAAGKGVLQMISDFENPEAEFGLIRRLAESSGRPLSFSLFQFSSEPQRWKMLLNWLEDATRDGLSMKAQVCGRPVGILLGLELSFNPFFFSPSYQEIAALPFAQRVEALRNPERKRRIISEFPTPSNQTIARQLTKFDSLFVLEDPVEYEPPLSQSLAAKARQAGQDVADFVYNTLLEQDGKRILYVPAANFHEGKADAALEMVRHKDTILGLGDGGAHCGIICDASLPTYMLARWARNDGAGNAGAIPLPEVVRSLTSKPAAAVGLHDRGFLRPGYRADLNVIDFDRLRLRAPEMFYDLPNGSGRLGQRVDGIDATIVNGVTTYRLGEFTGQLPGRLVRGAQAAPSAAINS
jgi:N-acyl-D-aspartate/D-glutamate deacylase